mgnify:CR=1 FL=1
MSKNLREDESGGSAASSAGTFNGNVMSQEELQYFKDNRKYLRSKVTRYQTSLAVDVLDLDSCEEELQYLESLNIKLNDYDRKIADGLWRYESRRDKLDQEIEQCEKYELDLNRMIKKVLKRKSILQTPQTPRDTLPGTSGQTVNVSSAPLGNQVKLPNLPLPEYSHKEGENFTNFIANFESIINKYSLNNYEKFIFLLRQLKGPAHILIESLQGERQNYEEAKALLMRAFASTVTQKHDVIKRLSKLQFTPHCDPYLYISQMRVIIDTLKGLEVNLDDIIQCFLWTGMSEDIKTHFRQITNENFPKLAQLEEHIFSAVERLKSSNSSKSARIGSVIGMAAAVNYESNKKNDSSNFRPCILCSTKESTATHPMHKCSTYTTPDDKVKRLRVLKLCTRCSGTHQTDKCKFKFRKDCFSCGNKHFGFLCLSKKDTQNDIVNQGMTIQINTTVYSNKTLLPTCAITSSCGRVLRIMKDNCAQSTFLRRSVAESLGLKVIDNNVSVSVKGWNATRKSRTKIVELPFIVNNVQHTINCVLIDEIPTSLNLPGLSNLVSKFKAKNYKLADPFFKPGVDKITNLELVIGADNAYTIPDYSVPFGSKSVFYDSPLGVMLIGPITQLTEDITNLKSLNNSSSLVHFTGSDIVSSSGPPVTFERQLTERDQPATAGLSDAAMQLPRQEQSVSPGQTSGESRSDSDHDSIHVNFCVTSEDGILVESSLQGATESLCDSELLNRSMNYEKLNQNMEADVNDEIIQTTLDNAKRSKTGRLIMPILWNHRTVHKLGSNYGLCKQILSSNLRKLHKDKNKLLMVDEVFREQIELGVIQKIENLDEFMRLNVNHSFLAHMPVIRMSHESTKVRCVYLSNICEKKNGTLSLSHNQAILPGPSLNQKISTAMLLLRFDRKVLVYDLKRAFLQIEIPYEDSIRLAFLWFNNVKENDYSVCGYMTRRFMFGLRCSPAILMLALYKILIIDVEGDSNEMIAFKSSLFNLLYVDNGAITGDTTEHLLWAYNQLENIFGPYGFETQQYVTNDKEVQRHIDNLNNVETEPKQKLLGFMWDTGNDTIGTKKIFLDPNASTKRTVLQTVAKRYDVYNICAPLLNRARIFLHSLQTNNELDWDTKLYDEQLKTWKLICKQVNSIPEISLPRFVGDRNSDYTIIACTDASKQILGVVLYCLDNVSGRMSFLYTKFRIIDRSLQLKSIPCLELQAVTLGVEALIDLVDEISGKRCIHPISITKLQLLTDSLVVISWINSSTRKLDKLNKKPVFVQNRLNRINDLCEKSAIEFRFCAGEQNPADTVTRCLSYAQLTKSNYFSGPCKDLLTSDDDSLSVMVPNPELSAVECGVIQQSIETSPEVLPLLDIRRCSSFPRVVRIYSLVMKFVDTLKRKLLEKRPDKADVNLRSSVQQRNDALTKIFIEDQSLHYPDVVEYFSSKSKRLKDIPAIVTQLNVFQDNSGVLRVKNKLQKWTTNSGNYPVLLNRLSPLTELIVREIHSRLLHSGVYSVLVELRSEFWVPNCFATVKKIIRKCTHCRRFNQHNVRLNQSPYREFRIKPTNIPFRRIFLDHAGPFTVDDGNSRVKVYLLIISCLWSRAINVKICADLSTANFLRALQLHVFDHGIPETCYSDLGSSIVRGGEIITQFFEDVTVKSYLAENGIKSVNFQQYPKGCNKLGGLVESAVKIIKKLIHGSIRNLVLDYSSFEFLIAETVHLANRRPIAFKNALRDCSANDFIPHAITPEILIRGHELVSVNIIPDLHGHELEDPDWSPNSVDEHVIESHGALIKARDYLSKLYAEEFSANLQHQATNLKDRYLPVAHAALQKGDIVLINDKYTKPNHYPLCIVESVVENSIGETTEAVLRKGSSRELIRRHVNSIIPLLSFQEYSGTSQSEENQSIKTNEGRKKKQKITNKTNDSVRRVHVRQAATRARHLLKNLISDGSL